MLNNYTDSCFYNKLFVEICAIVVKMELSNTLISYCSDIRAFSDRTLSSVNCSPFNHCLTVFTLTAGVYMQTFKTSENI